MLAKGSGGTAAAQEGVSGRRHSGPSDTKIDGKGDSSTRNGKDITMRIRFLSAATAVALAIVLIAVFGTAAGASPSVAPTAAHKGSAHVFVRPSAHRTLYDQNDQSNGIMIVSQKFGEPRFAVFDTQGADDFTVPPGTQWTVKEIDITGVYFNGAGPATSENVRF
jgi:hypothetical protein